MLIEPAVNVSVLFVVIFTRSKAPDKETTPELKLPLFVLLFGAIIPKATQVLPVKFVIMIWPVHKFAVAPY